MKASEAHDQCTIALGPVSATDAFGLSACVNGEEVLETIYASGPGIFRITQSKGLIAFFQTGAFQEKGAIIGFLQQGVLMLPVAMPVDGWLAACASDGQRVEHGSPVIRFIRTTEAIGP